MADFDREHRVTTGVADLIQTTSAVFDVRTGALTECSTYYPNGARETYLVDEASDRRATPEVMGFTGKEGDEEVGVVYFGERYLIPRIGRWATPDPLHVHASGGGEALNSFHYVSGNLLAARDPLGLSAQEGYAPDVNECGTELDDSAVGMTASGIGPEVTVTYEQGNATHQIQISKDDFRPLEPNTALIVSRHVHDTRAAAEADVASFYEAAAGTSETGIDPGNVAYVTY
ncbi:MAG: RHS repeat-associated core domain-containing protein [Sandaracinaceae bacterium]